jgi:DNA-binding FrmR family transcriptional regulator
MPINGHKLGQTPLKGPACHVPGQERKAAGVDPEIKAANLRRLRRIEGQLRGIQKMVEDNRYCADIIVQIASAQEALRGVGRALMKNHLQHCTTQAVAKGPEQAAAMYDELLELIYKHLR